MIGHPGLLSFIYFVAGAVKEEEEARLPRDRFITPEELFIGVWFEARWATDGDARVYYTPRRQQPHVFCPLALDRIRCKSLMQIERDGFY